MINTIEEKSALVEFRNVLRGSVQDRNFDDFDDHYLLRWLKARELNLEKAKEMLLHNLEWRRNNPQLETIRNWNPPSDVSQDIAYSFTGYDYVGHPVIFMPCGAWNMRKLIEDGFKEEMFQYLYKIMEEILARIEKANESKGVTNVVAIFDVTGLTLWKIASIETMQAVKRFFQEFESFYPEILSKVYVINAHWVFYYGFKLVKPLMSPNTVSKIEVLTNKATWKEVLETTMPSDCIPPECKGPVPITKQLTTHNSSPP